MIFNLEEKKDIISIIYRAEENNIDEKIKIINKKIEKEIKDINKEEIIKDINKKEEVKELIKCIENNYNIKISKYNEEMYKSGFIDGINMMIEILKNN